MLLTWLACTASDGTDSAGPATSPCQEEERAAPLAVGHRFEGDILALTVLSLEPEPAAVGDNAWSLDVGVEGCDAAVTPRMPDHGHGAGTGPVSFEGSTLRIEQLFLSMGGYWEVAVDLSCPDADEVVLVTLCVEP